MPAVAKEPLSLVLLANGASAELPEVVRAWSELLRERGGDNEILFVDDTASSKAGQELLVAVPELKLLSTEGRHGLGAALRVGLTAATRPLVACAPCDPRYPTKSLERLFEQIDQVHLVCGFRAGRRLAWPLRGVGALLRLVQRVVFGFTPRRLPGWLGWRGHLDAWLARLCFGVRLRDVGCPFLLCRRDALVRAPLQSDGDFCLIELIAKLNFLGCMLGEEVPLPVEARPEPLTRSRLRQVLREAYRVFSHPDFGPPQLPAADSIPASGKEGDSFAGT